jgi:DUSAM domain-containing protein
MSQQLDLHRIGQDWNALYRLEKQLDRGERLNLDEPTRALLRRLGEDVGLEAAYIAERLATPERAAELLREEWSRTREAFVAESGVERASRRLRQQRRFAEATTLLEDYIKRESVPWYRELARRELERVERREVPPYRPVRGFFIRLYARFLIAFVFPVKGAARRLMGKPDLPGMDE